MMTNLTLEHLKISQGDRDEIFSLVEHSIVRGEKSYCIPLNLTKYVLAKQDNKLRKVIIEANIVIADGMPIYWFSRRLGHKRIYRITGIEIAERIFLASKIKNWRIFFLGSTSENLFRAVERIKKKYELPNIIGSRNGYFQSNDIPEFVSHIKSLHPDILLLGLGMPQKEYFISDYSQDIQAKFWLPAGGAFDVCSGAKRRSPYLVQKAGLEWFFRTSYDNQKGKNILKYGLNFAKDFLFYRK